MKRTATLTVLLWAIFAGAFAHAAESALGSLAFQGPDGAPASLANHRGRYVLLNIWATWCAPCVEEMPALARLQAAVGGERFAVLPVSVDREGAPVVRAFFDKHGIRGLPVLVGKSSSVFKAVGENRLPVTILIDREGREVERRLGRKAWDSPAEIDRLRKISAGS